MKLHFRLLFVFILFFSLNSFSQDSIGLPLLSRAPNLVLPSSKNTVESFSFPYQDKIVYMHFWSSSVITSKEDFFKYKRIHKQNSEAVFKNSEGFDMIFVALQSNREEWESDIKKYNIENFKNYIAIKGFNDFFIKQYKLKEVPTGILVNAKGEIVSINPDVNSLKKYVEDSRNFLQDKTPPSELAGKITHGNESKTSLKNEKIYVTNTTSKDTIQTVVTNADGDFVIKNADKNSNITLKIPNTEKVNSNETMFIQNEGGDIISDFSHTPSGYEYVITAEDLQDLKSLKSVQKPAKNIYLSENLFKSGGNTLTSDAMKKLEPLLKKLNENPKLNIQITTHTDCKGETKFNEELSLKRANVIATHLLKNGISKSRIITIGKGESEPLNSCIDGVPCSDEELEINRRTEFIFFESKN